MKLTPQKLEGWGENSIILTSTVFDWSTHVTDRWTDDSIQRAKHITCYAYVLSRAKNDLIMMKFGTLNQTRKPSWRWQTRATWKHAKIALIRCVSFHFTEFHFAKFQITGAWRHAIGSRSRPIWLYIVWNPVFANYKFSCSKYKYLVLRLFS